MEIRNALQKIENYLTVVSNLNKTILSEGTMSRDELLLMKKYLYTSIDRIEDIERSLTIDKSADKSFKPAAHLENTFISPKEKEITEVPSALNIEAIEEQLENEQEELTTEVEQIKMVEEKNKIVSEDSTAVFEPIMEIPIVSIEAETQEQVDEEVPVFINFMEEETLVSVTDAVDTTPMMTKAEEEAEKISALKSFAESVVAEDNSLNKLFEKTTETTNKSLINEQNIVTPVFAPIESNNEYEIVTQNNVTEEVVSSFEPKLVSEEKGEKTLIVFSEEGKTKSETLVSQFEEKKTVSFIETLKDESNETLSFSERLEQEQKQLKQQQLFTEENSAIEQIPSNNENKATVSLFAHHEAVLVEENEVETIEDELTPSSLNDIFRPQTTVETLNTRATKTLSESIALNDKFIFVRELFGNQFSEYETGLRQLEGINTLEGAENYCKDQLWNRFNWNTKTSTVERFMSILAKRYN